ncbi:hypothetical protein ANTRET_LOCUS5177 [Anthophora retusa]
MLNRESKYARLTEKKGVKFKETRMQIALADGHPRIRKVQVTELETTLQGRTIKTKFIVLPGSKNNRTLLGVDFIDDAGIILNIPQRSWSYADTLEVQYDFAQEDAMHIEEIQKFTEPPPSLLTLSVRAPDISGIHLMTCVAERRIYLASMICDNPCEKTNK